MPRPAIHSGADDDFLESYLYYAKRDRALAMRFEQQFDEVVDRIAADPTGGTAYDSTYRFYSLKNYPHLVMYRLERDAARIVAVYHPSREPNYWRDR